MSATAVLVGRSVVARCHYSRHYVVTDVWNLVGPLVFTTTTTTTVTVAVCVLELPALIPAVLWTRKDIREFKDSLRKNSDNIIRISSLSIATVSNYYTSCNYCNLSTIGTTSQLQPYVLIDKNSDNIIKVNLLSIATMSNYVLHFAIYYCNTTTTIFVYLKSLITSLHCLCELNYYNTQSSTTALLFCVPKNGPNNSTILVQY